MLRIVCSVHSCHQTKLDDVLSCSCSLRLDPSSQNAQQSLFFLQLKYPCAHQESKELSKRDIMSSIIGYTKVGNTMVRYIFFFLSICWVVASKRRWKILYIYCIHFHWCWTNNSTHSVYLLNINIIYVSVIQGDINLLRK